MESLRIDEVPSHAIPAVGLNDLLTKGIAPYGVIHYNEINVVYTTVELEAIYRSSVYARREYDFICVDNRNTIWLSVVSGLNILDI